MAKETKAVNFRLPLEVFPFLEKGKLSMNQTVVYYFQLLQGLRKASTMELKGVFTKEEWTMMAYTFKDSFITDSFRFSKEVITSQLEEASQLRDLDKKFGVKMNEFLKKFNKLCAANIDAIYSRIEDLWNENLPIEKWAEF